MRVRGVEKFACVRACVCTRGECARASARAHGDAIGRRLESIPDDAGRKRDDVAAKLAPKDLVVAQKLSAAFKQKASVAAVNEPPAPTGAGVDGSMSLIGAPPPATPAPSTPRRTTGA